jgi:hypothetical protein
MSASTTCLDFVRVRVRGARANEIARCEQELAVTTAAPKAPITTAAT